MRVPGGFHGLPGTLKAVKTCHNCPSAKHNPVTRECPHSLSLYVPLSFSLSLFLSVPFAPSLTSISFWISLAQQIQGQLHLHAVLFSSLIRFGHPPPLHCLPLPQGSHVHVLNAHTRTRAHAHTRTRAHLSETSQTLQEQLKQDGPPSRLLILRAETQARVTGQAKKTKASRSWEWQRLRRHGPLKFLEAHTSICESSLEKHPLKKTVSFYHIYRCPPPLCCSHAGDPSPAWRTPPFLGRRNI